MLATRESAPNIFSTQLSQPQSILASPGMETESAAAKGLGLEAFQWAPPSSNHVKQGGPICSIDDVIVYCRNELWVIKKHMVKCRVEPVVVCVYFG